MTPRSWRQSGTYRRTVAAIESHSSQVLWVHEGEELEVELAEPGGLEVAQEDYLPLTSSGEPHDDNAGGWRPEWLVIGHEVLLGDPVFVNLADADLPVYTAQHGMGSWRPIRLADSLVAFLA